MKFLIVLPIAAIVAACAPSTPSAFYESWESQRIIKVKNDNPAYKAIQYINFDERTHRTELKELTGVDPVRTEWCAAFVNSVLEESDIPNNNDHKYPLTARAFLDWGEPIPKEDIEPGDIVVFPRGNQGWQGHVGFFVKEQIISGVKYYYILGGNQSNKVSIQAYRASRALGIRRSVVSS